jgi:heat shock protein HslJ
MSHFLFKRAMVLCATACMAPALWAAPASAPAGANTRLRDTHWTLASLGGAATDTTTAGSRTEPHLVLKSSSQHLIGFAGCNRLRGRFTQRGTQLALKPIATTRMACASALMQQEERYLQTLASIDSYRIEGQLLSLMQGDVVKATFRARTTP